MARGGYRAPKGGPRASGVGKNSQRTDAAQLIQVPNVGDATDLTHGDRQKLEAAQRVQRIGRSPTPSLPSAPPRGGPSPAAGGGAVLPPHLMEKPSTRPMEDEMTPASPPPVEPADDKEVVLQFLVDAFGDENANKMLTDLRASKQVTPMQPTTFTDAPEAPVMEPGEPEAIELGGEDLATEGAAAGEEVDQTSVETPAAPSEIPLA